MQPTQMQASRLVLGELGVHRLHRDHWVLQQGRYQSGASKADLCLILGDLNAEVSNLPTLGKAISEGWVDVGACAHLFNGVENQPTCDMGSGFEPTRIDFAVATECLWPLVKRFGLIREPTLPVHSVLQLLIEPAIGKAQIWKPRKSAASAICGTIRLPKIRRG